MKGIGHRNRHRAGQQKCHLDKITLVGNPNVGKSVIFGLLTGKYVTVSNYPGTTVEITSGNIALDDKRLVLIDTPGVNSLIPMSEDEKVTRDILLAESPSSVLQVGDAKNLKRTLLITLQIAEMGFPMTLDLNMIDEAMDKGITIDIDTLQGLLGIDVVSTIAPQRKGLKELREAMLSPKHAAVRLNYGPLIEEYISRISRLLPQTALSKRSLAVMILSEDDSLKDWLKTNVRNRDLAEIEHLRHECILKAHESPAFLINKKRIEVADQIAQKVIRKAAPSGGALLNAIGNASMHPVYGIPVLLIVLYGLYEFVGVLGAGVMVDFVQSVIFGKYINPMATKVVEALIPVPLLQELLVGQYGLITVALTYAIAIILPITVTFFIAFAVLEDSGYLPRLAIMSNRGFNMIGLNGKAVLPMVLGLGCGTMAVMTSRILETRRDRIITTFLLALAIPCSAQLGVILGILGSLSIKAAIIWTACILIVLFVSGFLASKLVSGERTEFFLEVPPIRMPNLMNIIVKTVGRVEWYLKEAVPLFLLGTFILFLLHKLNLLVWLENAASPVVVNLLHLPPKTTASFILGFLRRDYGAAGLFDMAQHGELSPVQSIVSLVTITLFLPCLASLFMIIKERGLRTSLWIVGIVFPIAFLYGGLISWLLRRFNVGL
ncbi:MAG TPA: ferrous iron transport protein B [Dissulfurispiraceae bacterium]|nr:ferrous iron transport protein B [Dissulfurispiraceae bacterium]